MKHANSASAIIAIITILVLTLLSGCTEKQPGPLRISSSPWPGYEPLYLARDLGYFDADKVKLFELPSSDITMEAFRNHSTDLGTLTLDETLELMSNGTKLRILLVLDISNGGDAVLSRPEITTLKELKGKTISIVNIPLGLYMLSRTLEVAGIARTDVTVLPMSESRQEAFYKQGKADAVITFEPVKTKLLDAGAHVLFDSSQIPNEILDLLVVHEDVFQQRRADICHVVKQWFNTLDYMQTKRDDAAARISRRLGIGLNDYEPMMSGIILPTREDNQRILGGSKPEISGPAEKLTAIMQKENLLSTPITVNAALDPDFVSCFQK